MSMESKQSSQLRSVMVIKIYGIKCYRSLEFHARWQEIIQCNLEMIDHEWNHEFLLARMMIWFMIDFGVEYYRSRIVPIIVEILSETKIIESPKDTYARKICLFNFFKVLCDAIFNDAVMHKAIVKKCDQLFDGLIMIMRDSVPKSHVRAARLYYASTKFTLV